MPYENELASKASHFDIVQNPDVAEFLENCTYLKPPSEEEAQAVAERFEEPPSTDETKLPDYVIAVDGSNHETSIDDRLPSTKVGYIKIGSILIDMRQFGSLRDGRFVDPFRVADLQKNNTSLTLSLPSANIRWDEKDNVRDSFRAILDKHFYGSSTRFDADDPYTSLRTTLFHLASRRPGDMHTGDPKKLKIHKCPDCGEGPVEVEDKPDQQHCPHCKAEVYPTDCLRLWEEVSDFQSNRVAITRLMMIVEHLLPVHYMRYLRKESPIVLSAMAFFVDGPLAVYGNAAWLHRSIMIFLSEINKRLEKLKQPPMLVIGLQKTGQVVDHVNFIERFVPSNRIYAIDDEYRYRYILSAREPAANGFGYETYYGQDFIYKTATDRTFVFAVPYPFDSKDVPGIDFVKVKTDYELYSQLAQAIALIDHFESDLYENAVVPIALAHRYTAISLMPGGKVLDLLTQRALEAR